MTDELEHRLRKAYPNGLLEEVDETVLVSEERDNRIKKVVLTVNDFCNLNAYIMPFVNPSYEIVFTKRSDPPYDQWIWKMPISHKLAWIRASEGSRYNFLVFKISRVADYFYFFHNYQTIRCDTEFIDVKLNRDPCSTWKYYEIKIHDELQGNKFKYFTEEMSSIQLNSVRKYNYDAIPPDDPRWDDIDYEPPLEPASLHNCLFSH